MDTRYREKLVKIWEICIISQHIVNTEPGVSNLIRVTPRGETLLEKVIKTVV